ncbi:MAG: metallophosphoesterase [Methanomicrobiales archaeon]
MIGIIADTHDNLYAINKAVDILNKKKVDLVIHAGDLISPFTVKEFSRLKPKFLAVFGNNDGERNGLKKAYEKLCFLEDFKEFNIENKRFCLLHGTNEAIVDALKKSKNYDVIIRGHTHRLNIQEEDTLVINPGEVCGYVTGEKTLVLLDPKTFNYDVIQL